MTTQYPTAEAAAAATIHDGRGAAKAAVAEFYRATAPTMSAADIEWYSGQEAAEADDRRIARAAAEATRQREAAPRRRHDEELLSQTGQRTR